MREAPNDGLRTAPAWPAGRLTPDRSQHRRSIFGGYSGLHLEKSLEPDVLEAAGDVLRVLRAEETNRAAADPEVDLPLTGSRAFRASAPMPLRSSRMARSWQWDSALAPHRFCRLDPNNLMIIREGLVRGRVVAVATAVWVSYVLLLALAMTFGGTANA
jgi:hypothetical protein